MNFIYICLMETETDINDILQGLINREAFLVAQIEPLKLELHRIKRAIEILSNKDISQCVRKMRARKKILLKELNHIDINLGIAPQ